MNAPQMDNMRLVVAWPTVDYKIAVEEDAESGIETVFTHKFKYRIPAEQPDRARIRIQNAELKKPNGIIKNVRRGVQRSVFPITDQETQQEGKW
jgi:hypothetical protein